MIKILLLAILMLTSCGATGHQTITLTPTNHLTLKGTITPAMIFKAQLKLIELDQARKSFATIFVVIESPGGSIDAARNFTRFAKSFKNIKTICIYCASAAAGIMLELPGERLGVEDVEVMLHEPMLVIDNRVNKYLAKKILDMIEKISDTEASINSKRIGISKAEYQRRIKEEWSVFGQAAIAQNLIDRIVTPKCSKKLASQYDIVQVRTMFGTKPQKQYKCPFIRQ